MEIIVDTEARAPLHVDADSLRRSAKTREIVPDEVEGARIEAHRVVPRRVVRDGFSLNAVWTAFNPMEDLPEAVPDSR